MQPNQNPSTGQTHSSLLLEMHRRIIRHFCIFYFGLACLAIPPSIYSGDAATAIINSIAAIFYSVPAIIAIRTPHCYRAARLLTVIAVITLVANGIATNLDTSLMTLSWYFVFVVFAQLVLDIRWSVGVATAGFLVVVVFTVLQMLGLQHINPDLDMLNVVIGAPAALFFSFCALLYLLHGYNKINHLTIQKLVEADADKGHLVKVMSHDLRNSLGAIKGLSFLLEENLKGMAGADRDKGDSCVRSVRLIDHAATSALELVEESLAASRDGASMVLDARKHFAVDFLEMVVARHALLAQRKNIQLSISQEAENIPVLIDKEKFSRVMDNLLSNAIKFCSAGDSVTLDVRQHKDHVQFSVVDTGIGIPDALKDIIFEPFTRAGRRGTANEATVGLGMSIIKKLVEMHDGSVFIRDNIHRGTAVHIHLPLRSW